jgi:hypothetical protein
MKILTPALALAVMSSCRSAAPIPSGEHDLPFELRVNAGERARIVAPDGTTTWSPVAGAPEDPSGYSLVAVSGWYRGAGIYTLTIVSAGDAGEDEITARVRMTATTLRADAVSALIGSRSMVWIVLLEPPPAGLRLERSSPQSDDGRARYLLVNDSDRPFKAAYVGIERWNGQTWQALRHEDLPTCGAVTGPIAAHTRRLIDVGAMFCLRDTLPPGRYRHFFHVTFDAPVQEGDVLLGPTAVELWSGFDLPADSGRAPAVFGGVPLSELKASVLSAFSDEILAEVVSADGGTACVCQGLRLGSEGLVVTKGVDGICLTRDAGAAPAVCEEQISGRR